MLSSKNLLTRHWVNDVYGRHPMNSGDGLFLCYTVLFREELLFCWARQETPNDWRLLPLIEGRHVVKSVQEISNQKTLRKLM